MWYLTQRSFMKALEPSRTAASADGPKALMPSASSRSTSPATSGASGPTTTKSIFCSTAKATSARMSSTRSEEHTSELQSLMRISYAVFCLKKKKTETHHTTNSQNHLYPIYFQYNKNNITSRRQDA